MANRHLCFCRINASHEGRSGNDAANHKGVERDTVQDRNSERGRIRKRDTSISGSNTRVVLVVVVQVIEIAR